MAFRRRLASVLGGVLLAGTLGVGSAAATAINVYNFYDCTGPAPSSFTAMKTETPNGVSGASAFHIDGTRNLFVVLSFVDLGSGIARSGHATVACQVNTNIGTVTFYGFIVTAG